METHLSGLRRFWEMRRFPLALVLTFFDNHGLLDIRQRPQWYVVPGGSREYDPRPACPMRRSPELRLNTPVQNTLSTRSGWRDVATGNGKKNISIERSSPAIRQMRWPCWRNHVMNAEFWAISAGSATVVLHSDHAGCRCVSAPGANWNYRLSELEDQASACVTYNMNILRGLPADAPLVLRHPQSADAGGPALRYRKRMVYEHPLFNPQKAGRLSCGARGQRGRQRSWFLQRVQYNSFHEDGVRSALDVVNSIAATENR